MKYLWRIKRLFLKRDIKELIDRYDDTQEYFMPCASGSEGVGKRAISSARSQGLIKWRSKTTEHGKVRLISLTKKGLRLSQAKYVPNWEKMAALIGIATLTSTLFIFAYQIYTVSSMVTSSYTFAYTEAVRNPDDLAVVECWEGVTGRSDELRCVKGDNMYVPCFVNFYNPGFAKCPRGPDDQDAKIFRYNDIREGPVAKFESDRTSPWFIVLGDGTECHYLTGATNVVANRRLDFGCSDETTTLYLPLEQVGDSTYIGCLNDGRVERCFAREVWY